MQHLLAMVMLLGSLAAAAAGIPNAPYIPYIPYVSYDEAADAQAEVRQAQAAARWDGRPLLLVFGANWCEDCRALDRTLKSDRNATLIAREFRVVKIDVGRFDRNLDIAEAYGNPIKQGIPAAVIVSPAGRVLYATRAGELADARRMNEAGVYGFFREALAKAKRGGA